MPINRLNNSPKSLQNILIISIFGPQTSLASDQKRFILQSKRFEMRGYKVHAKGSIFQIPSITGVIRKPRSEVSKYQRKQGLIAQYAPAQKFSNSLH